ncbi:hypothetical protein MIR68_002699 [Amoeboaphelidium protococcarum]|nr:hypothetical protein MIR68_002699 [Amoeboaphelidium protococcarum]
MDAEQCWTVSVPQITIAVGNQVVCDLDNLKQEVCLGLQNLKVQGHQLASLPCAFDINEVVKDAAGVESFNAECFGVYTRDRGNGARSHPNPRCRSCIKAEYRTPGVFSIGRGNLQLSLEGRCEITGCSNESLIGGITCANHVRHSKAYALNYNKSATELDQVFGVATQRSLVYQCGDTSVAGVPPESSGGSPVVSSRAEIPEHKRYDADVEISRMLAVSSELMLQQKQKSAWLRIGFGKSFTDQTLAVIREQIDRVLKNITRHLRSEDPRILAVILSANRAARPLQVCFMSLSLLDCHRRNA